MSKRVVFLSCWSHQPVPSPALFSTDLPHLSKSTSHPPFLSFFFIFLPLSNPDIVHENLKMGSDGESDQASGTSSDEVQSPTGVCLRNRGNRRISAEVGFASLCCHGASIAFLLFSFKGGKWVIGYNFQLWRLNMLLLWIMSHSFLPGLTVQPPLCPWRYI